MKNEVIKNEEEKLILRTAIDVAEKMVIKAI